MKKLVFLAISIGLLSFCAAIKEYQATYREELEKADKERFGSDKLKSESPVSTSQEKIPYKIIVVKHPDLNFPATDPNSVVIYEGGFMPLDDKFFTIAKIGTVDFGELYDDEEFKSELKLKAAEIGGHALIMVDLKTESKEFGGGITAKSFPQYFWWFYPGGGFRREYTGSEYYVLELPKQTITSYSRIYAVIKFQEKTERELRSSWKNGLRSGMEETVKKAAREWDTTKEFWEALLDALCKDYPLATPKGIFRIWLKEDKEGNIINLGQAFKLSHEENIDRIFQIYEEKYPLADKEDFVTLSMKTDENGEFLYTFEEAMKISHQKNKRSPEYSSKIEKRLLVWG